MLIEAAQAAVEAAKQGSVTIAIPTAFLSSAATLLLYKGVPALVNVVRGKPRNGNGAGVKPGEGMICRTHGEEIAVLNEFKDDTKKTLEVIGTDIKTLLQRVPGK